MTAKPIKHIDATGLICPMPLMLLKQAIAELNVGEQLTIVVTDEHAELDFDTWCERFGHGLEKHRECDGLIEFSVIKCPLKPRVD